MSNSSSGREKFFDFEVLGDCKLPSRQLIHKFVTMLFTVKCIYNTTLGI